MGRLHEMSGIMKALEKFEGVQEEFADFGAADTEPDGRWHDVVSAASWGGVYPGHVSAFEWGLFLDMVNVQAAAIALTAAAKAAHREIEKTRMTVDAYAWELIHDFLMSYAWRAE